MINKIRHFFSKQYIGTLASCLKTLIFYISEAGAYNGEDESTTLYFEQKYFFKHLFLNSNFNKFFRIVLSLLTREYSLILFL